MNQMKSLKITSRLPCLILVWTLGTAATAQIPQALRAPKESVAWPPEVERIADELYKNKVAAMASYNMRLLEYDPTTDRDGFFRGKAFVNGIQALADAVDDRLIAKAKDLEGTDFVAKLIVLADDRKARPECYETIRTTYVDFIRPTYSGKIEQTPDGSGASVSLPPAIHVTPKVRPQHLNEEWRLPLEYAFFAPPTAFGFPTDMSRFYLSEAISIINTASKSNILMLADAASLDQHIGNSALHEQQLLGLSHIVNRPNASNAGYLESVLSGEKHLVYRNRILETKVWIPLGATDETVSSPPPIWQPWLDFFKENPAERGNAKRLAELFEKAAAKAGREN
jgi:hypothetical protein